MREGQVVPEVPRTCVVTCCMHADMDRPAEQFACQHSAYEAVYKTIREITNQRVRRTRTFLPNTFQTDQLSELVMRYVYLTSPIIGDTGLRHAGALPHYVCSNAESCMALHQRATHLAIRLMNNIPTRDHFEWLVQNNLVLDGDALRSTRIFCGDVRRAQRDGGPAPAAPDHA